VDLEVEVGERVAQPEGRRVIGGGAAAAGRRRLVLGLVVDGLGVDELDEVLVRAVAHDAHRAQRDVLDVRLCIDHAAILHAPRGRGVRVAP
jgi:hypothetical protein